MGDSYSMNEDEKIEFGTQRKDIGANLFKTGRLHMALDRYKKVIDILQYTDSWRKENQAKAKEMKKLCELNRAACQLQLKDFTAAKTSCNNALKAESLNVKALFRRAQAELGLKNYL